MFQVKPVFKVFFVLDINVLFLAPFVPAMSAMENDHNPFQGMVHRDHFKLYFIPLFVACLKVHNMGKHWCQNIKEFMRF